MDTDEATDINSAADALVARMESRGKPAKAEKVEDAGEEDEPEQETADGEPEESDETEEEDADEAESDEENEDDATEKAASDKKPEITDDITVKVKVNGEEREVPFSELRKGYMMGADYTRKTQELAEHRRGFTAHAQQYEAGIKQRVDELGFLAQTFMQHLTNLEGSTDWNDLRQKNPAEYAARQQDIQQRKALLGRAFTAYQTAQQQQSGVQQQHQEQLIADQAEKLPALIPEWLDVDVANREKGEVAQYLSTLGVPAEQLNTLHDALTVAIARKAMMWDRMQTGKQQAAKAKQKPVPKFTGTGPRDANASKPKTQKLAERAKRSGRFEDWGNALAAKYS
ncbi:hypothetical protein [Sphingomonas sp.]|jgi:hypothetical protein|uniref:hypothetical protein n=1 Tax=Sphingomonas sp. TaxID=28214 RepID=UPI003561680E